MYDILLFMNSPAAANQYLAPGVTQVEQPPTMLVITQGIYPWIRPDSAEIPLSPVTLGDGTQFLYGSIVRLNRRIERISRNVSGVDSISAQTTMLMGLPSTLAGKPRQGISKVENSRLRSGRLLIASRNLIQSAGLVFVVESPADEDATPVVLRAGISYPHDRKRLLKIMGVNPIGGRRRKS